MTLNELLAKLATEMAKGADDRDDKIVAGLLDGMSKAVETGESNGDNNGPGYAATKQLTEQIAQLRRDLDSEIDDRRKLQRAGLAREGGMIKVLGYEEIKDLRRPADLRLHAPLRAARLRAGPRYGRRDNQGPRPRR